MGNTDSDGKATATKKVSAPPPKKPTPPVKQPDSHLDGHGETA
jgi:hypothetical protein